MLLLKLGILLFLAELAQIVKNFEKKKNLEALSEQNFSNKLIKIHKLSLSVLLPVVVYVYLKV